ncbi:hypothetical protein [uncultured Deinococcus sp.]|uniref:hypothetical protein n=1 Tax=uncultured Deinococcus sp. TaxID=158789 RepID=UPI0025D9BEB4|nr:hypothetical protein [uncultured Deinococcus sp.]
MTVGELRDRIEAALGDAGVPLGTALVNDTPTPAIVVGDWPEGTTVTGLEVVIRATPNQETIAGFEFIGFVRSYRVRLINWSGTENLEDACNALAGAFWPLAEDPAVIPQSPDYPEQVTLALNPD